jgi:hypothetical protein
MAVARASPARRKAAKGIGMPARASADSAFASGVPVRNTRVRPGQRGDLDNDVPLIGAALTEDRAGQHAHVWRSC